MKVLVPCAGRSSRYPNMPPKWMLPTHDGQPMISRALAGLNVPRSDIIVTILAEHDRKFDAVTGLRRAFGETIQVVVLEKATRSQSETVAETLRLARVDEPFLVKDSDNTFSLNPVEAPFNFVSVASLNDFDSINARNKSYCRLDHEDIVLNIREKVVISDTFSVGGYYFTSARDFLSTYDRLMASEAHANAELYLSDIIGTMILDGHVFKGRMVKGYHDWGTVQEWRKHLVERRMLLVSLDGYVFERGSAHFAPRFEDVTVHAMAAESVIARAATGDRIVYLSIRPSSLSPLTERQLSDAGLPKGTIVYDCPVAPWNLITVSDPTLPFSTSDAQELNPLDPNLAEKV